MQLISNLALLVVVCASSSSHALLTPTRQSVVGTTAKVAPRPSSVPLAAEAIPRGGANANGEPVGTGTATIPNEVFNLVKSIVGAGVLSLPAGKYQYNRLKLTIIYYYRFLAFET
jgi:hypothetical protein